MAYKIDISKHPDSYNKELKTFTISERGIPFGTEYEVWNPGTGNTKMFKFSHSTGPEFSPDTRYVYKSDDLTLEVCNDAKITAIRASNYLAAKTRKNEG